jgi:hypothetical protein
MRATNRVLMALLALFLVVACGKDKPTGDVPSDQLGAQDYYRKFTFNRGLPGRSQYAQSGL